MVVKKCPQCGNDIHLDSSKCSYCGYSSDKITESYSYGNSPYKNSTSNQQSVDFTGKKYVAIVIYIIIAVAFLYFLYIFIRFSGVLDFIYDVKKY